MTQNLTPDLTAGLGPTSLLEFCDNNLAPEQLLACIEGKAHAAAWHAESLSQVKRMEGAYEKGRQAGRDEYRRRLEALKIEMLDWQAARYVDMLVLGQLDPAEFDKRINGLKAEWAAFADGEKKP